MKVLDAGCGRNAAIGEIPCDCHVVGIDISREGLAANPNLDERIVGDLETYPLPEDTFDLAVCWDVLEHLRHPQAALDNLTRTLKPGGKLIIGIPNLLTPKVLATKFTPHRFHVLIYRRLFKFPNAGVPSYGPFPTFLRWSLRPSAIKAYASAHNLIIEEFACYPSPSWLPVYARHPPPILTAGIVRVWKVVSGGTDPRDSELRIVLRKPAPSAL